MLELNRCHVGKFQECRLTDVGENRPTREKEKHAQNVMMSRYR